MSKPARNAAADPGAQIAALTTLLRQVEERSREVEVQAGRVRELLAEVRGATKDLKVAARDSRAAYQDLAAEAMQRFLAEDMGRSREALHRVTVEAEHRVVARFDALYNLLMTGHSNGRAGPRDVDLNRVIAVEVAARRAEAARVPHVIAVDDGVDVTR